FDIDAAEPVNDEVILIGGRTCGKPYGFIATDNCGVTYNTIQFSSSNDIGFGDYAEGFKPNNSTDTAGVRIPGCQVSDDLNNELGDPNEAMLSAALSYRQTLSCPAISSSSASSKVAMVAPGYDFISPDGMTSLERPRLNGMILRGPE
ncbi:MAG: peptidase, partial [Pseudomonadota bacterium]